MNTNINLENVRSCGERIDQQMGKPWLHDSPVRFVDIIEGQLIWSSRKPDDWEILVYKQAEGWEVCFFRWPLHHEHAIGSSFDAVRQRAEQRIRALEAGHLRATSWQRPATATSGRAGGLDKNANLRPLRDIYRGRVS